MSEQRCIGMIEKNSAETIRINLQRWGRGEYCDIRVWMTPRPGDEPGLHPTRKGITISTDLIDDLITLLQKAKQTVEKDEEPVEAVGEQR